MKKLLIAFAFVFSGTLVQAQIAQGTLRVGGTLNFMSMSTDASDDKASYFGFGPEIGYFVADDLEAIVGVEIGSDKMTPETGDEMTGSSFDLTIGVRKYFMSSEIFGFFGGVGVGIGSSKDEVGSTVTSESSTMDVGLNAGFTFWPTSNIGLTTSFGMLGMSTETEKGQGGADDVKNTTTGLMIGNGVDFTFSWFFNQ